MKNSDIDLLSRAVDGCIKRSKQVPINFQCPANVKEEFFNVAQNSGVSATLLLVSIMTLVNEDFKNRILNKVKND